MAEVRITAQARKQAAQLPRPVRARLEKIFIRLANWPDVSGAKPLRHELSGHYRIRTGDYRVQFYLQSDRVIVEKVGHRDGFYEN